MADSPNPNYALAYQVPKSDRCCEDGTEKQWFRKGATDRLLDAQNSWF